MICALSFFDLIDLVYKAYDYIKFTGIIGHDFVIFVLLLLVRYFELGVEKGINYQSLWIYYP